MKRETDSELLMERPAFAADAQQVGEIKSILFHVHQDKALTARLQIALTIARAHGAHLQCLHVTPIEAYTVMDLYGGAFVNSQIAEALEESATKLQREVESELANEDVSWDYEEVLGELVPRLVQRAALSDLLITGREPRQREFGGPAITLLGDLLQRSRTPLLVVGEENERFDPFGPAVIAWNGSYEAANAVRNAVPLLRTASEVRVIRFTEDKEELFQSNRLLEYLSRHGIHAEVETLSPPKAGIDVGLVEYATGRKATMIVMGGYSHSRAGQFLFGGVTRRLLKSCAVPLFLSR
ncbi:MAG TPA: universal stress protein [Sphingomicrobium sp.]|jgi:nucleotide-binding universal stress UspA family protein|nr:universal stress protein [Sphingomicrobium sp.]